MNVKVLFVSAFLMSVAAFAGDGPWSHSLSFDGAIYPKYKIKTGDDHFSPTNGPYDGMKGIVRYKLAYELPTPLGTHPLLSDAKVELMGFLELTPITFGPKLEVDFTPLPFLVFKTGASVASGWTFLGFLEGMSIYDWNRQDYKDLTPFAHYHYDFFLSGKFQFDTGALIEGDWSHVVMFAEYKVLYEALTGVDDGRVWQWQESARKANGWAYDYTFFLGYQMPLMLDMFGVMAEFSGHYDKSDYGIIQDTFDGDFTTVDLSLMLSFKFNKNNALKTLFTFERNRSYATMHDDEDEEPLLVKTGAEWSFNAVYFSWTHSF